MEGECSSGEVVGEVVDEVGGQSLYRDHVHGNPFHHRVHHHGHRRRGRTHQETLEVERVDAAEEVRSGGGASGLGSLVRLSGDAGRRLVQAGRIREGTKECRRTAAWCVVEEEFR